MLNLIGLSINKPRITLALPGVRNIYPDFVWRCGAFGTTAGFGLTPKASYEYWKKQNTWRNT